MRYRSSLDWYPSISKVNSILCKTLFYTCKSDLELIRSRVNWFLRGDLESSKSSTLFTWLPKIRVMVKSIGQNQRDQVASELVLAIAEAFSERKQCRRSHSNRIYLFCSSSIERFWIEFVSFCISSILSFSRICWTCWPFSMEQHFFVRPNVMIFSDFNFFVKIFRRLWTFVELKCEKYIVKMRIEWLFGHILTSSIQFFYWKRDVLIDSAVRTFNVTLYQGPPTMSIKPF